MKQFLQIKEFLKAFIQNNGDWVFAATAINKIVAFCIQVYLILYLQKAVFGQLTFALSVIGFIIPFAGLGANVGLLRFGSITNKLTEKKNLYNYSFTTGLFLSILIGLVSLPFLKTIANQNQVTFYLLLFLLLRIPTLFIFESLCVFFRINEKNDKLGQVEITESILLILLVFILTPIYGIFGYVSALLLSPTITFIGFSIFNEFPKLQSKWNFQFNKKQFWNYSIWASFANVIALLVFLIDIIIIGFLLGDEYVAEYKAAAIIPTNLLILPAIFIKTDFKKIAENYLNKSFLKGYYKNFSLLFLLIGILLFIMGYFGGEWMFSLFNYDYNPYHLFLILLLGALISMALRVPLGNIIGAIGKTKINTFIGLITILIDIALNLLLIPQFGLNGAAYATVLSLIISGILSYIYFVWYLKTECE